MSSSNDIGQRIPPSISPRGGTSSNDHRRARIARACDICRRRKIKCNIAESKVCTACQDYDYECTFNDVIKKRGPPKGYIEHLEARLKKMEQLLHEMQTRKRKRPEKDVGPLAIKNILNYDPDPNNTLPKATIGSLVSL